MPTVNRRGEFGGLVSVSIVPKVSNRRHCRLLGAGRLRSARIATLSSGICSSCGKSVAVS